MAITEVFCVITEDSSVGLGRATLDRSYSSSPVGNIRLLRAKGENHVRRSLESIRAWGSRWIRPGFIPSHQTVWRATSSLPRFITHGGGQQGWRNPEQTRSPRSISLFFPLSFSKSLCASFSILSFSNDEYQCPQYAICPRPLQEPLRYSSPPRIHPLPQR